jgi:transposase
MKRESDATAQRARRRHTAEFRREVVEKTLVPGASVAAIALEHRLNANLLFTWRRNYLRTLRAVAQTPRMLPVMVEAAAPLDAKPAQRAAASVIEIELAAGRIRLKGAVDVVALRAVIDLLARR